MDIAALRTRITIQKSTVVVDQYGNHKSAWADYFMCWATASKSGMKADETQDAGHTQEADRLDFTVRWSSETAAVDSKNYRVLLDGRIYNIVSIDEQGFRKYSRKFSCELVER